MADPIILPSVGDKGVATLGKEASPEDAMQAYYWSKYVKPVTEGNNPFWDDFARQQTSATRGDIGFDVTDQNQAREQQNQYLQMLHRQAQGDPNSLAQRQLREQSIASVGQIGGAAAARGNFGGAGAGMRFARNAQNAGLRQMTDNQRVLLLQEQEAAREALAAMYEQQRKQDTGLAQSLSSNALTNAAANDRYQQGFYGLGAGGMMQDEQRRYDFERAKMGLGMESDAINKQFGNEMFNKGWNALMTGAGTYAGMSGGSGDSGSQKAIDSAFYGE